MPRDWHPIRFFVREDGRRYPTILFWLFFVPLLALVIGGCYAVLNRRTEQIRLATALMGTPTPAATETSAPTATSTPGLATGEPTPTEYVYDDPSSWEFVERTDPSGTTYLDLQDWQKEQVWHAFEEFWDIYNRNETGLPSWETLEPYIAGAFVDFARGDYDSALGTGRYIYLVERVEDIPHRAMILGSSGREGVKVKVIFVMERSYQVQYRDVTTGAVVEDGKWLPYQTWNFIMSFRNRRWVIEQENHELFAQ
jgi:hypothetical protein